MMESNGLYFPPLPPNISRPYLMIWMGVVFFCLTLHYRKRWPVRVSLPRFVIQNVTQVNFTVFPPPSYNIYCIVCARGQQKKKTHYI